MSRVLGSRKLVATVIPLLAAVLVWLVLPSSTHSQSGASTNYRMISTDAAAFGRAASAGYRLYSTTGQPGGEGVASSTNYRLQAGFVRRLFLDTDADGCVDSKEVTFALLDLLDPWDFYSVPVPALFAAPNPLIVFRDGVVGATDAQAIFAYFKKLAKTGSLEYEQDLNGNGVKDGIEYDRSVVGPGQSGPPNGVVTAQDAQLAFAQFKLLYVC